MKSIWMDILRGSRDRTQGFVDKAADIADTLGQGFDAATRKNYLVQVLMQRWIAEISRCFSNSS